MNRHWWSLDETDEDLPITSKERQSITMEALDTWLRSPKARIAYICLIVFCIAICGLTIWAIKSLASGWPTLTYMIGMLVCLAVFLAGMSVIKRFGYSEILHSVLKARGFDVCMKCGYNLCGTQHEKCPECGWRREVLDEPKG